MSFSFQAEQWLPYPVDAVFSFLACPANLPPLMPPGQKARIDDAKLLPPPQSSGKTPMAGIGSRITLSFRPIPLLPLRTHWLAEITEFELNSHFVDVQIDGPFAFWSHVHRVRAVDRAGINFTIMVDQVEYQPPVARLADTLFVRRQLERTFAYRQKRILELMPAFLNPVVPISKSQPAGPAASGKLSA